MINILVVGNDKDMSNKIKAQLSHLLVSESIFPFIQKRPRLHENQHARQNDIIIVDQLLGQNWENLKNRLNTTADAEVVYMNNTGHFFLDDIKMDFLPEFIKNFKSEDLNDAIKLAIDRIAFKRKSRTNSNVHRLPTDKKIIVKKDDNMDILSVNDIFYIQAWGKYCLIFTKDGNKYLTGQKIKNFKKELEMEEFFQIHKSYLMNANYLKKIKHENLIELTNGICLPLARRRRSEILSLLSSEKPEINIMHIDHEQLYTDDTLK